MMIELLITPSQQPSSASQQAKAADCDEPTRKVPLSHLPPTTADLQQTPSSPHTKRKRQHHVSRELNSGEVSALARHARVAAAITRDLALVVSSPEATAYFASQSATLSEHKEDVASHLQEPPVDFARILESCIDDVPYIRLALELHGNTSCASTDDVIGRWVCNRNQAGSILTLDAQSYIIPPESAFLMCDMRHLSRLLPRPVVPYDVIVVDPPWDNKSARRSKSYGTMSTGGLKALPIASLCHADTWVFVWCTNRAQHLADLQACPISRVCTYVVTTAAGCTAAGLGAAMRG